MSNFLTDGRLALLEAFKNDSDIASAVKNWFEYGSGLKRRRELEAALCPFLALAPEEGELERVANVQREIPQVLRVDLATEGQDARPVESLAAMVIERVRQSNEDCLGLAGQGLAAVRVRGLKWEAVPAKSGPRIIWTASIPVQLLWRR